MSNGNLVDFWERSAPAPLSAAAAVKLVQRRVRAARDDHSNRPALWNRFYAIDWGDTTTNNYGFAPGRGRSPAALPASDVPRAVATAEGQARAEARASSCSKSAAAAAAGSTPRSPTRPGIFDATGLDVAASAVAFCRATYGESDRLRFVEGSALDLPFPDASFDVVLNVEASNDYGDRRDFFSEVARVLKPDGMFLYTDSFRTQRTRRSP